MVKKTLYVAAIILFGMSCNSGKGTKREVARLEHDEKYYDKIYAAFDFSQNMGFRYYIKGKDTVCVRDPMMPPPPPKQ